MLKKMILNKLLLLFIFLKCRRNNEDFACCVGGVEWDAMSWWWSVVMYMF